MSYIRLVNMVFYAYHGVHDHEKKFGSKFEIDIEMKLSISKSSISDRLDDTIDYDKIYSMIESCVFNKKFNLIETLAGTINKKIMTSFRQIESIKVRVRKPHAPIKGIIDTVEVELGNNRSDYE